MSAVLCLHPFTGTPADVAPVTRALESHGYRVSAPLLPGHGDTPEALARASANDWLRAAEDELFRLRTLTGGRVSIVGASMGALLALRLAHRHPDAIAALVLMSAPLRVRPIERRGIEVLAHVARLFGIPDATIPRTGGVDAVDPALRNTPPAIQAFPLSTLNQLLALAETAADAAPSVTAPALVIHGRQDRTVPLEVSEQLAATLASTVVERLWLADSGHFVAVDSDRDEVAAAVSAFLAVHAERVPVVYSARAHSS